MIATSEVSKATLTQDTITKVLSNDQAARRRGTALYNTTGGELLFYWGQTEPADTDGMVPLEAGAIDIRTEPDCPQGSLWCYQNVGVDLDVKVEVSF